jgi:hypothetical protein
MVFLSTKDKIITIRKNSVWIAEKSTELSERRISDAIKSKNMHMISGSMME